MLTLDKRSAPSVRFNPSAFKAARKAFDRGSKGKLIAMMQEAATDSFVAGCLVARRSGFQRPFTLAPPEGVDIDPKDIAWLRSTLRKLGMSDLLRGIHEALLYEYAVPDFDWQVVGGRNVPVNWELPNQLHFAYAEDGRTLMLRRGARLEELPEDVLVARSRWSPVMLPVLADFILWTFGYEAWAAFIEQWGEPLLVGRYPAGADADFRAEVQQAVDDVASSSRGIAPEGTSFDVISSGRTTGDHERFTDRAQRRASIALVGHENGVQQSGAQIGDNSSAIEVMDHVADTDCGFVEPIVQRLVDEIWSRNIGGVAPMFALLRRTRKKVREELDKLDLAYRHRVRLHVSNYTALGLHVDEAEEWIQMPPNPFAD